MERQKVLQEKTKKQNSRIPFVLTCVRTLPNVKRAIANNLDLVYVNREFKDMFQQSPISPLKKTELEQKPLWLTKMQEYCRWENAETIQEKARIFNEVSLKTTNRHRKDVGKSNKTKPQTYQHFKLRNHMFNQHAVFTLIE